MAKKDPKESSFRVPTETGETWKMKVVMEKSWYSHGK